MIKRLECIKCKENERIEKQRYCKSCNSAYMKEWRTKNAEYVIRKRKLDYFKK